MSWVMRDPGHADFINVFFHRFLDPSAGKWLACPGSRVTQDMQIGPGHDSKQKIFFL